MSTILVLTIFVPPLMAFIMKLTKKKLKCKSFLHNHTLITTSFSDFHSCLSLYYYWKMRFYLHQKQYSVSEQKSAHTLLSASYSKPEENVIVLSSYRRSSRYDSFNLSGFSPKTPKATPVKCSSDHLILGEFHIEISDFWSQKKKNFYVYSAVL